MEEKREYQPEESVVLGEHPEVPAVSNKGKKIDEGSKNPAIYKEIKELELQLASKQDFVSKIQLALAFMAQALAQPQVPQFKCFWEAKALCLTFFKENISPSVRTMLWSRYQELTQEARRLKQLFDEQTAFAVEQIDVAIQALEKEIQEKKEVSEDTFLPKISLALQKNLEQYRFLQSKLNGLNAYAVRINVLRKELIKTEMRISQKNKFFQRLSAVGEQVFPTRKELIRQVSDLFDQDIQCFVDGYFTSELPETPLYRIREEIKTLQSVAKYLTLNTSSFSRVRASLSGCWDRLKEMEKELKKSQSEKKQIERKISQDILQQIAQVQEKYQTQDSSLLDAKKALELISQELRSVNIGRQEVVLLREALLKAMQPLKEKEEEKKQLALDLLKKRENERRETYQRLRREIDGLRKQKDNEQLDNFKKKIEAVFVEISSPPLTAGEVSDLKQQLKTIEDVYRDRLEFQQISICSDKLEEMGKLLEILNVRKKRRQEIKIQLERHRKGSGVSGLDFEQSMKRQEELLQEKERLDQLNRGIQEIEYKISFLKGVA